MYSVDSNIADALRYPVRKTRLRGFIDEIEFTSEDILKDTFSITLQSSDTNDFTIGAVYVGQLKLTIINRQIISALRGSFLDRTITPYFEILVDNDWSPIPLGTFYVAEADHAADGVVITAYDGMSKLDRSYESVSVTGSWFQIVSQIANRCDIELGFDSDYADTLINQALTYDLYIENDCETCRDLLFWLTQIVGGFAYFTKDNKLMIKDYGEDGAEEPIDLSFYPVNRSNAKFSDFFVNYQDLTLTHIEDGAEYYHNTYSLEPGRTYSLGRNPFLQFEYGYQNYACQSIIERLRNYKFYPFQATIPCDPRIELGDHIKNFQIRNGGEAVSTVQYINFRFGRGMTIKGFGSNEKIGNSSNPSSGGGGATNPGSSSNMVSLSYTNSEELEIGREWVEVSRYKFAAVTDAHVMMNLMLPIISDLDGDVSVKFVINTEDGDIFTDQIDRGNNLVNVAQDYFFNKGDIVLMQIFARAEYYETDDRVQTARIVAIEDYIQNGGELPEPIIDTTPPSFEISARTIRSFLWAKGIDVDIGFDGFIFVSDSLVVIEWPFTWTELSDTFDFDLLSLDTMSKMDSLPAVDWNDDDDWPSFSESGIKLEFGYNDAVPYCGEGLATGMGDVLL